MHDLLLRKILWPVTILSSPVMLVLAALVALGALSLGYAIVGAVGAVVGLAILTRKFFGDIEAVQNHIDRLSEGDGSSIRQLALSGPIQELAASLDRLQTGGTVQERGSGDSGLDALPDPVLTLDGERRVVRVNAAARRLFGPSLAGHDLSSMLRNPALLEAADNVLQGTEGAEVEFAYHDPVERNFSAHMARLPAATADGARAIIVLYDITAVKRAEEMRSDFVANVSHELRTPVSVLLGCVQTLRGSARDDPEAQAEFFGLMQNQAERMSRLVDDLLSLSRIEMNEHTTPSDEINVGGIVGQVAGALGFSAEARGVAVETDFPDGLPSITGDKDELTQLFQNLIDNAIKYSAENSTVHIGASLTDDVPPSLAGEGAFLAVAVRDQGEGIPPEHLPRLTERFYRVDTARSRELGGTGLGLAIVKHISSRHRGALTIDSTPGEGSTFTIYLPVAGPDGENSLPAENSA